MRAGAPDEHPDGDSRDLTLHIRFPGLHFDAAGTGPSLQFLYHQNDAVRQITYPGSVVADLQYEPGTGVLDQLDVTHQSAPRYALDYQPPDALLRVVGRTETLGTDPAELTTYGYDPFGRLDTADHAAPSGLTDDGFVYDDSGNRKDAGGPSSWIFDEANVLTASPDRGYTVDADGNLEGLTDAPTSSTLATLTWTTDNRLASYTRPSGETAGYAYDPFGRRIRKTVDPDGPGVGIAPTTTWYVWDGERLLAEHDEAGVRQRRYDYALGFAPVRMIEGVSPGELAYNVHADHLDTPKVLTDAAGDVVWKADHEAFGQAVVDPGVSTVEFNIRFPGQYYDDETRLHYNRFRYYDPSIGRYISADPIGQLGGINAYNYAANSPTNLVDPTGLFTDSITASCNAGNASACAALGLPRAAAAAAAAAAAGNAATQPGLTCPATNNGEGEDDPPIPPAPPFTSDERSALRDFVSDINRDNPDPPPENDPPPPPGLTNDVVRRGIELSERAIARGRDGAGVQAGRIRRLLRELARRGQPR